VKSGASYVAKARVGTGSVSRTSSFSHGVRISGGRSASGAAAVRYAIKLRAGALAYRRIKASVLARSTNGATTGVIRWPGHWMGEAVGPRYGWFSLSGSRDDLDSMTALFDVEADGPAKGAIDIGKVRLTWETAVWR
jgi:hypothetical protein